MKILFLTNIPSPYRVDFFNELGKKCDLTVIYENNQAIDRNREWLNNKAITYKEVFLYKDGFKKNNFDNLKILKYLNNKFDHIIIGGYHTAIGMLSILYLKFHKIPFILSTDGGMIKNDKKIVYIIKKFFISSANSWLSTSDETTNYLLNYGAKIDKIYKYPFTSVKKDDVLKEVLSEIEKKEFKNSLEIVEEKAIISVGQFIPRKGFDVLIQSMRNLPKEYGVYIVGGEVTKEFLELKENLCLDNLHFIPFKNKKELLKYYYAADLFVLPTREDIWGLVINEAMATGLPIITTNKCIAGIELVKNGVNGFIVPVEDVEELSSKIKIILENNSLGKNMGRFNLNSISYYTIENMVLRHLEIFNQINGGTK